MKLIWHTPLAERDWFEWVLGDVVGEVLHDPEMTVVADDAIHVVSGNVTPLHSLTGYFARCARESTNITLLHASDEWFSGGYGQYRFFDHVIRTHHNWMATAPGVLTIPLGCPNGGASAGGKPADQRAYAWSFAGEIKASRFEMARAFAPIKPSLLVDTALSQTRPLDRQAYRAVLDDTVFLPCPMGNVMLETWRLYEALEHGCIPITESRVLVDYYRNLLGPNPIPRFRSWREAAAFVIEHAASPGAALALQTEIVDWWLRKKQAVRASATALVTAPSQRAALARFARRPGNRSTALHRVFQIGELLRHQSVESTARRVLTHGQRLVRRD